MPVIIYSDVTAQVSQDFLRTIIGSRHKHKEAFFSDIARQAGLSRFYKGGGRTWFFQGDFDSIAKARNLLESAYEVTIIKAEKQPLFKEVQEVPVLISEPNEHDNIIEVVEAVGNHLEDVNDGEKVQEGTADEPRYQPEWKNVSESVAGLGRSSRVHKAMLKKEVPSDGSSPVEFSPSQRKEALKDTREDRKVTLAVVPREDSTLQTQIEFDLAAPKTERIFRKGGRVCKFCSKVFSKLSNLNRHMKVAHQGLRFQCLVCTKKFTCKESLSLHSKVFHEGLRCSTCSLLFDTRDDLTAHQDGQCTGEKARQEAVKCEKCGKTYSRLSNLNRHMRMAHKGMIYSCEFCSRGYRSKDGLLEHQRNIHSLYKCSKCDTICESEMELKNHMESIHSEKYMPKVLRNAGGPSGRKRVRRKATCEHCGKVYSDQSKLNHHVLVIHKHVRHQCEICDKSFASKSQLRIHRKVFHEELNLSCSLCSHSFLNRASLARHQQFVHKRLVMENIYQCEICGRSFLYKCNLWRHKKVEHEGLRASCKMCGREFRTKQKMLQHYRVDHEGERFLCPRCPKIFKNKFKLREHEVSAHTSLKPHTCHDCGEKFARRSCLLYHVRKHHILEGNGSDSKPRARPTSVTLKKEMPVVQEQTSVKQGESFSQHTPSAAKKTCSDEQSFIVVEIDHPHTNEARGDMSEPEHFKADQELVTDTVNETTLSCHKSTLQDVEPLIALSWGSGRGSAEQALEQTTGLQGGQPQHCSQVAAQITDQTYQSGLHLRQPNLPGQLKKAATPLGTGHHLQPQDPIPAPAGESRQQTQKVNVKNLESAFKRDRCCPAVWEPTSQSTVSLTHGLDAGDQTPGLYSQALDALLTQCLPAFSGQPTAQTQDTVFHTRIWDSNKTHNRVL